MIEIFFKMTEYSSRSSLIHFVCVGVALPRLCTPQAKGIIELSSLLSLLSCLWLLTPIGGVWANMKRVRKPITVAEIAIHSSAVVPHYL